ncbi:basic salivary proline-rich protein 2-like [Catharus ustulatus]|uniref:basic salivary proline-rich protein 2-like n=1 Tax=Catharus ustulatus TaxID=91951 RepID=UPI00140B1070|nr:basic salivary proline-rich protein 2-like [Catharus ustulatus]
MARAQWQRAPRAPRRRSTPTDRADTSSGRPGHGGERRGPRPGQVASRLRAERSTCRFERPPPPPAPLAAAPDGPQPEASGRGAAAAREQREPEPPPAPIGGGQRDERTWRNRAAPRRDPARPCPAGSALPVLPRRPARSGASRGRRGAAGGPGPGRLVPAPGVNFRSSGGGRRARGKACGVRARRGRCPRRSPAPRSLPCAKRARPPASFLTRTVCPPAGDNVRAHRADVMAPQRAQAHSRPASPSLPPARHVPAPRTGPGAWPGPARAAPRARGSFSNGCARASLTHRRPSKAPGLRSREPASPRARARSAREARGARRPPAGRAGRHRLAIPRPRAAAASAGKGAPPAGTGRLHGKPSAEEVTKSAILPSPERALADRPERGSDSDQRS